MKNKTAVLVLAAGSSKRMGVPKQLLKYKEGLMLSHILNNALSIFPEDVYVVLGANNMKIAKEISDSNVNIIINKNHEKGIGSSIAIGIKSLMSLQNKYEQVLILLGDQPSVSSKLMKNIVSCHLLHKKSITVTQTILYTGVPVVFDALHFSAIQQISGDDGAKEIIKKNKNEVVNFIVDAEILDIDTMDDYNKIIKSI